MSEAGSDSARSGPVDVLVTGAAGFIGSALVRRLSDAGATVQGVDIAAGDMPTLRMDVSDGAQVLEVLSRLRPRKVVHAAAVVDDRGEPDLFIQVNVCGTQNMLDASAAVGVERFLQISSIAALGLDPGPGADESSPLRFDTGSPYFDTKAASEELVRHAMSEHHLDTVIVRPGDVYGPGSKPWVERPLAMMRRHAPVLIGRGKGLMAHCWIDNLVDGLLAALETPGIEGRIFQIHDGSDTTTYKTYFGHLARAAGLEAPRASVPKTAAQALGHAFELSGRVIGSPVPWTASAVQYLCRRATYSIASSREVLGYEPRVSLEEGIAMLRPSLQPRPLTR